ncbi:hypothetical protein [Streptomonospora nanhaiensis]|uniref:hypothetical protein n=1 Tax=Streptomonospora nanhaiensis TaxID=1323731 RepID=UPI001C38E19C|nr:hypothetical protein [Streptomonospora nanhaiensis]MBV2364262.1 hypothetical protein [Streptomonospora nanhaiensis]
MAIDLTSFQSTASQGTAVTMPEGDQIVLRPMMALGSQHDQLLIDLIAALGDLGLKDGQDADLGAFTEVLPLASRLLAAAAPTSEAAERLDRLPLMARVQVLLGYVEDQDLGGLSPSAG